MDIRPAGVDDIPAIVALVESAYRGDASRVGWTTEAELLDGQRTDAEAVAAAVAADSSVILLARDDTGELVACCQLDRHDDRCYFGLFAVRPTAQGSGIGRQLLGHAETYARERYGAMTMEMTVIAQRDELIAWYERRGYKRTGETRPFPYGDERFGLPRRDDLHFIVLTKPL